jgi:hypothetical protein
LIAEITSGILFWLIIIILIISGKFGYKVISDLNSDDKLQEINKNPKRFKTGTKLAIIEHLCIIALAVSLFIAFNSYGIILAVIWTISRTTEGIIQIYNKKSYWGLLNTAKQYSKASRTEKQSLSDLALSILKSKNTVFKFAQILFSIGTISYSILFVTSGVVPEIIGWFGIIASIIYGLGNGIQLAKPNLKTLWNLGGLLIWIFEIILGSWLLLSPIM